MKLVDFISALCTVSPDIRLFGFNEELIQMKEVALDIKFFGFNKESIQNREVILRTPESEDYDISHFNLTNEKITIHLRKTND